MSASARSPIWRHGTCAAAGCSAGPNARAGSRAFDRLVCQVMTTEPYASARRVFWIVDNGSSHRGQASISRLQRRWPNLILVHTPIHASWVNQIEIYFSIVQRKVLTPNDFDTLPPSPAGCRSSSTSTTRSANRSDGSSPATTSTTGSRGSPTDKPPSHSQHDRERTYDRQHLACDCARPRDRSPGCPSGREPSISATGPRLLLGSANSVAPCSTTLMPCLDRARRKSPGESPVGSPGWRLTALHSDGARSPVCAIPSSR